MSPSNRALTILAPWRRTLTRLLAISALAITGAWASAGPAAANWPGSHGGFARPTVTTAAGPAVNGFIKPEIAAANNGVIYVIGPASVNPRLQVRDAFLQPVTESSIPGLEDVETSPAGRGRYRLGDSVPNASTASAHGLRIEEPTSSANALDAVVSGLSV